MGLLTLTPQLALADGFDSPAATTAAAAAAPVRRKSSANQELAERVAKALDKAKLGKYDIDIDVRDGVVTLLGSIGKSEQRAAAEKTALSVAGVKRVVDRLEVVAEHPNRGVQQAAASMPRSPVGPSQNIRRTSGEQLPSAESAQMAYAGIAPERLAAVPPNCPPGGYPQSAGGPGMYQRTLPGAAYPAGAQYPNYAGVSYPGQQAASAYPYIGPFYPYPQIPLGWRKASLEWDDGYWNLNFRSRTDRWWWYLNPQNW
jgi:hypothetical protein